MTTCNYAIADAKYLSKFLENPKINLLNIVNILCTKTFEERTKVLEAFKLFTSEEFIEKIGVLCGHPIYQFLFCLSRPKYEFFAIELNAGVEKTCDKNDALIDIMCTLDNDEMSLTQIAYEFLFKRKLQSDLENVTNGYMQRLMVTLCAASRSKNVTVDECTAKMDASALKQAVGRFKTNQSMFVHILCSSSTSHLRAVADEFVNLTERSLEGEITRKFSSNIRYALLAIMHHSFNPVKFFVNRLFIAKDRSLTRLCVMLREMPYINEVKREFLDTHGFTLKLHLVEQIKGINFSFFPFNYSLF
jgi:energy-coupling factor transporter ATP-binding protein EcfA2